MLKNARKNLWKQNKFVQYGEVEMIYRNESTITFFSVSFFPLKTYSITNSDSPRKAAKYPNICSLLNLLNHNC